jgi:hypothetical protein
MSVGFSRENAKRVADVVRTVERMPGNTATTGRRQNNTPILRTKLRGKLDAQLNGNATAAVQMSIWAHDGSGDVATGEKIDVWPWMLKTTQMLRAVQNGGAGA